MARSKKYRILLKITTVCAACSILYICWNSIGRMDSGADARSMQMLEDAVRKAAVACYSVEGSYPDRLDYLVEKYGLQLNDKYAVHYSVFASNLAPDITVVMKPSEEEIWAVMKK